MRTRYYPQSTFTSCKNRGLDKLRARSGLSGLVFREVLVLVELYHLLAIFGVWRSDAR